MLNHDKAAIAAMEKLQAAGIDYTDASGFYKGFNDINEHLTVQKRAVLQLPIRRQSPEKKGQGIRR